MNWISRSLHMLIKFFACHELARIILAVMVAHSIFFLPTSFSFHKIPKKREGPLNVKTVKLTPSTKIGSKTVAPKGIPGAGKSPEPLVAEKTPSKTPTNPESGESKEKEISKKENDKKGPKNVKASPSKKATGASSKNSKKKNATTNKKNSSNDSKNKVDSKLLAQALQSLGQVNVSSNSSHCGTSSSSNQPIGELDGEGEGSLSYEDAIGQFLKLWIRLPEYGQVTVQLTINHKGKITAFKTLHSESERNRLLVEDRLPKLTFPIAQNTPRDQAERTLTLVLSNE